jgi:Uma2 family endonuclease
MAITRQGIGLAEFLELPEEKPALEYEAGRITQKVSPKAKHGRLQTRIAALMESVAPDEIGVVFIELRTTFAGSSRVPDIAFIRRSRVQLNAEGELENDVTIPPDIAVEIRSPEQSIESQLMRCRDYIDRGVELALMVDPESRRIWVFRRGFDEHELGWDESFDAAPILPGFVISPASLFASLRLR